MKAFAKPLFWRLLFLAVVGAIVYGISLIPFSEEERHFRITDADVDVEVQDDASIRVTEELTFKFVGGFQGAYRDIPLAEGVRASNVRVSEGSDAYKPGGNTTLGSYGRPGTYGAQQLTLDDRDGGPTGGFRVVWHYSAANESKTFTVSYDVEGVARAYDDVVVVPWAVWGSQWQFWLDDLDAEISLASGDASPEQAWLRPRSLGDEPELNAGSASVDVQRLAAGEETALTAVFPRDAFRSVEGAQAGTQEEFDEFLVGEQKLDDDNGPWSKFAALAGGSIVAVEIGWTLIVLGIVALMYLRARERPMREVPKHLPEPPEEIPPALAYAYAHEGEFDDRLVLATLLDLVDRGFYEAKPSEGKELDLVLSRLKDRPDGTKLEQYEVKARDFFDLLLEKGPCELGKLKNRIPNHSAKWRAKWESLVDALNDAEGKKIKFDVDLVKARTRLAWVALAGYLLIGIAFFDRTHQVAIPLFAALAGWTLLYVGPASALKRQHPESRLRQKQWTAFSNWTRDFPRLADDPPATLDLWRRILVFAVAFGTAERVIASGRIPEPVVEEARASGLWLAPHVSTGSNTAFTPSFSTFGSSFASQVAPEVTSSSGGGGGGSSFSGGGGGFSGGGGGGAW